MQKWGVYNKDKLIAIFFNEAVAKDYEQYQNRMMQTCRFETFKIKE